MSIPTQGEEYTRLIEYLRKAQESAALLSHLVRDDDALRAKGWLAISEQLRLAQFQVTQLAKGRLQ